jgi:PAS domain-containing protein
MMSRPVVIAALLVPAIITTIVVVTNSMHHLMWADIGVDGTGPARVDHGAWFQIHGVVSYLYVIAAVVILARGLWSAPGFHSQAVFLVPAVVLPLMLNIVFVAGVIDTDGYDLTPFAFLVSGGAIAYCLFRLRFLDLFAGLVPVARDAIVEGMADGVLVIDDQQRVVDVNPAAARLLGVSLLRAFGTSRDGGARHMRSTPAGSSSFRAERRSEPSRPPSTRSSRAWTRRAGWSCSATSPNGGAPSRR